MNPAKVRTKILCVDDEPNVLEGIELHLRRSYDVTLAPGGHEGLELIRRSGPFAVVLSDMRMPRMDGASFLTRVRETTPDTARILLTGHSDVQSAIKAVNEGRIFRFLTKPCPPTELISTVNEAVEQHRLTLQEREMLEQTVHGSIKVLSDVLSLANPTIFGRVARVKHQVVQLCNRLGVRESWSVEAATHLSQIAYITLPQETAEKLYFGQELANSEKAMVDRLPNITDQLLANIPRLEPVRNILRFQNRRFDGADATFDSEVKGEWIPIGSRILKCVFDFDLLLTRAVPASVAVAQMQGQGGCYDPQILEAFAEIVQKTELKADVQMVPLTSMRPGMRLAEDVRSASGALLIAMGHEVTNSLLARLLNLPKGQIKDYLRVHAD